MAVEPIEVWPSIPNLDTAPAQSDLRLVEAFDMPQHNSFLGYTPVPSEGLFSLDGLRKVPRAYLRGLGRLANAMLQPDNAEQIDSYEPERRIIPGHNRTVLVTEPQPFADVDPTRVVNDVLFPGLSEMDIGSAYLLHVAMSRRNPDRRTITMTTPGVSVKGEPMAVSEGYGRRLDDTAAENLRMLPWLTKDGATVLTGTSLGSYMAVLMAEKNLAANPGEQRGVTGVNLLSPAVGARNINREDVDEDFEADASDPRLIRRTTREFFAHMPIETVRMAFHYPEAAAECAVVGLAYMLAPQKYLKRGAAIRGNLVGVQQGIEWESLKQVATSHRLHVLGGELCPLVVQTIPQYKALMKIAPRTKLWVVEGQGHAMTIDAEGTAKNLARMERADAAQWAA